MTLRVSTASNFQRVLLGLRFNQLRLVRAQEQTATGRRILRPSDDPTGAVRSISLTRRISDMSSFRNAIRSGLASVDTGAEGLRNGAQLLSDARELLIEGMNGTLQQDDREALAAEIEVLRGEVLDLANTKIGDRYLFGGTSTARLPWVEVDQNGLRRVIYRGNDGEQLIRVGVNVEVAINVPGQGVFGKIEHMGTTFAGLTGVSSGTTADEGTGYEHLTLRHDATDPGLLASVGLALVGGGVGDTILGDQSLVIDVAAGTIQLGGGTALNLPQPGSSTYSDFVVANEMGGTLHLDFSGFTDVDYTGTVRGDGSISLDGSTFVPLDFLQTDLELRNQATGAVIHVDTSGIRRAGQELVNFSGAVNVFDVLHGIAEDLRNGDDLLQSELLNRLNLRLTELDRNQENMLVGVGVLGSRSARMNAADDRLQGVDVQLRSLLSQTQDADYSKVVLDLTKAEQTLQIAQATGVRLIQTTLLNFLR